MRNLCAGGAGQAAPGSPLVGRAVVVEGITPCSQVWRRIGERGFLSGDRMVVDHSRVDRTSAMGATVWPDGTGFRTWAPNARAVSLVAGAGLSAAAQDPAWRPDRQDSLAPLGDGSWGGFLAGLGDGEPYMFFIDGAGSTGWKRDPFARELTIAPAFPDSFCVVRDPASYPWHDQAWRPPPFADLIIYQLHIGTWWAQDSAGHDVRATRGGTFLDAAQKLGHLRDLGVTAVQLLPVQEFETAFSLGYNGVDYFSPEGDYAVTPRELPGQLAEINAMLASFGRPALTPDQLAPGVNQLKCLVDLCHLHGIAVILDLVYNHAGGGFDDRSMWFYDRQTNGDLNHSLFFTDQGWAGGQIFAYWNQWVAQFLIDNARFFLGEYRNRRDTLRRGAGDREQWRTRILPAPDGDRAREESGGDPDRGILEPGPSFRGAAAARWSRLRCRAWGWSARRAARSAGTGRRRRLRPARFLRRGQFARVTCGLSRCLARRAVSGEPGSHLCRPCRRRPHIDAGGCVGPAILVRPQPQPRRHVVAARGTWDSVAVHGRGVPRGQELERRPPCGRADLVGRAGRPQSGDARLPALRHGHGAASPHPAGVARRRRSSLRMSGITTASSCCTAGSKGKAATSSSLRASTKPRSTAMRSACRSRGGGASCSIATSTTTSRILVRSETVAPSRPPARPWMASAHRPRSPCRQTA